MKGQKYFIEQLILKQYIIKLEFSDRRTTIFNRKFDYQ